MQALGVDISNAGSGPEGAREFLGRLSHERQRGLVNGCRATLASPYFAAYYVLSFCQNLVSATQNFPRARRPSPRATGWRRMVCCRHLAQRARGDLQGGLYLQRGKPFRIRFLRRRVPA